MRVKLHEVASARAGDKGDVSSIALFCDGPEVFEAARAQVPAERLTEAFPRLFRGPARRYEIPHLHVLNYVIERGLEGGVNASLNLDAHGKSFSFLLLELEIDLPDRAPDPAT
ncbi:hypothetical protein P2H44_15300 [Albimonas sp. CAU 1670]|uniref:AtuA-related protein n=1 Tax=Albimonas sp. CAU 1670 TaxID=3032599 RepID=UPI0023DBF491|nr:hypothetical protein [Albimonas sp. CAU 1670]MDF2233926.1 hypothetical protein [Albimonas sp. CAU 1670]